MREIAIDHFGRGQVEAFRHPDLSRFASRRRPSWKADRFETLAWEDFGKADGFASPF